MSTLIIAEAGVNHNGDIKIAKQLIEVAADSGADIVKFQTLSASSMVTQNAAKANYQLLTTNSEESQFEMLKKLELSREMHEILIRYSDLIGIKFFSTAFDISSANMLLDLGQELFKIPSGEITNLPYLRHIGSFGKSIIISTGMANVQEIKEALEVLENSGMNRKNITVLHCTTAYPAPYLDVNLKSMESLRSELKINVGYSDHTLGIEIPIAAVALGASVIEKHFTLDRQMPGPDHKASLEPNELKAMVKAIRNIESSLGDGVKRIMPSELENREIARKSIVAAVQIRKGESLTSENITTKRPGTGLSPMKWDQVIGLTASRNYQVDEQIDET
jgi:N,N'-diacetyllegionaminate synthase